MKTASGHAMSNENSESESRTMYGNMAGGGCGRVEMVHDKSSVRELRFFGLIRARSHGHG